MRKTKTETLTFFPKGLSIECLCCHSFICNCDYCQGLLSRDIYCDQDEISYGERQLQGMPDNNYHYCLNCGKELKKR